MVVRRAEPPDLPAITDIYNHAVLTSTATFDTEPRSLEQQRRWLDEHGEPYAVLVAVLDGEVVGWASLSPWRAKPAYRYTAEDSLYIHREHQGKAIGVILLSELLNVAEASGFHTVIAGIVPENEPSLRLHRRLGFREVGHEREVGYKFDRWLDVVLMQKLLGDAARPS
ncbi:MAG: N-acetyltransferase [Chloroflexi bacterium]|nr:N-acetyltransferase [Chloroflexota bacterium]